MTMWNSYWRIRPRDWVLGDVKAEYIETANEGDSLCLDGYRQVFQITHEDETFHYMVKEKKS